MSANASVSSGGIHKAVQLLTFWVGASPQKIHQGLETSHSILVQTRNVLSDLHRRPLYCASRSINTNQTQGHRDTGTQGHSDLSLPGPEVCGQLGEVPA